MNVETRHPWFRMCLVVALVAAGLPACGGSGDSTGDVDADLEGMDGDDDIPGDGDGEATEGTEGGDAEGDGVEGDGVEGDSRTCTSGGECSDSNPCTLDECRGGFCVNPAAPDGTVCDDDLFCMLPGQCLAGVCEGIVENSCDDADLCTDDLCDETLAECAHALHPRPGEEGPPGDASCGDGVDNDCDTRVDDADPNCIPCETDPDCNDDNECTVDTCDAGVCRNEPGTDGTPCDDGQYCSVDETCQAGACTGGDPRDCSDVAPVCNVGRCNEAEDRCLAEPIADGTSCSDGLFCTIGETCAGGECGGGGDRDCSMLTNQCNLGACDEAGGACVAQPVTDGTACDDGAYCTTGETCAAGVCGGGTSTDCSSFDDRCNVGTCDETAGACFAVPVADGAACDDGLACNVGEACLGGMCGGGAARDCSSWTDACNTGACSEASGGCVASPLPDTTACEDGLYCTTGDQCAAGACAAGAARGCADTDPCTTDSCNESSDACDHVLTPVPGAELRGTASCSDGIDNDCDRLIDLADPDCGACTTAAQCNDGNPCTTDACTGGVCANSPVPAGTTCDDGQYCTVTDRCTGTVCGGSPRDCSSMSSTCNTGRCNELTDSCYADPLPDTTTCSDGQYCTAGDHCSAGTCVGGGTRDCSASGDACNLGVCDEAGDVCTTTPRPGVIPCADSLFCTEPDTCTAGLCGGPARDCSSVADQCNTGRCNETADACQRDPLSSGTLCDADGVPATRDICLSGACAFSACGDGFRDASGGEHCDDGNTLTESCQTPPASSCVRDCSIRQDTCGNGTFEPDYGEQCDDGDTDSFDGCTTSCTINDGRVGAPCTCSGSACRIANPTAGTITGCSGVVAPTGSLVGCARSGTISGNALYFANGFCTAYAHRCSPGWLCGLAGIPSSVGSYSAFVGGCPAGTVLLQYTVSSSGVTLETKSCQKVCTSDADCRWNEYDPTYSRCGHYECMPSPSTPGTNVCFDSQSAPP